MDIICEIWGSNDLCFKCFPRKGIYRNMNRSPLLRVTLKIIQIRFYTATNSHTCLNTKHPFITTPPQQLGESWFTLLLSDNSLADRWYSKLHKQCPKSRQDFSRQRKELSGYFQTCSEKCTAVDPRQGLSHGLGGELSWGCCSCKTSETKLKWSRKKGERERKVALRVAELSGACVFPWWVIYWCLSGMNRSKAAGWQAINHTSNQGWQSSNKTENKENQLLPVPPPEKNNFSVQSDSALSLPCAGLIKRHI